MAKYFSKKTRGFYDKQVNGNNMPADVVEITDDDWRALLDQQSKGKRIDAAPNGYPIAIDRPKSESKL
jgi:hypothetical protein